MSEYPNLNVTPEMPIHIDDLWLTTILVRRSVEMRRASKFKHEPRNVLRLRLFASNPISVRGLSHYRRGVSRCYFHSSRNLPLLSHCASRLRTRLQWPSLLAWEESVEIRSRGGYRCSDSVPTWSLGYRLFLASFFFWLNPLYLWLIESLPLTCSSFPERSVTQPTFICVMPMM